MERRTFLKSGGALLLVNSGCQTVQQIADSSPPAKTPVLTSISTVVPRTCAWTTFPAAGVGTSTFALLPSGHVSGDIRMVFQAPYPSAISADIDGTWVLRQADNTQGPGEGYYKINSITLASTKDTFDWDVTFTPWASSRVKAAFQLNIRNVSINSKYSGTDKTSPPLSLTLTRPPPLDVDAWLIANPTIQNAILWEAPGGGASPYGSWAQQDKDFLRNTFRAAWNTDFLLLADPPGNQVTLGDTDAPKTGLGINDAWPLFISHVAYSLAAELGGWTSWSLTGYSSDQLAILLDSRETFRWDSGSNSYVIHEGSSLVGVVPASPWTTLSFLYQNGIYTCRSRIHVINQMLEWCRTNLIHFGGDFQAKNMEDQWQYRGCPPVVRMIQGTPWPSSPVASSSGIRHRTAGCWGSTGFLRAVLRVLNIPVKHEEHEGHSMPYFMTEGLYMDHGDDPYSRLTRATPPFAAHELLIDQSTRDAWFGTGVPHDQQAANVGRQTRVLAIKYLSDELLSERCADIAANKSHADSAVFGSLNRNYTVADLEALKPQDLWTQLDAKIAGFGGCTKIPTA
jgi:hypothetical protein